MTTSMTDEGAVTPEAEPSSGSWANIAFRLAQAVAAMPDHNRGGLADLRRMDPDKPNSGAFWRLMAQENLLGDHTNHTIERKWGLVLHGIALMTRTAGDNADSRSAHDGKVSVGQALYLGTESKSGGFYSETRLGRLLTARDDILRVLLARLFRMLAAAGVSFNWCEMAVFILSEGYDEEQAEQSRRRIARDYYREERHRSQKTVSQGRGD